jgi:hypothetical protein
LSQGRPAHLLRTIKSARGTLKPSRSDSKGDGEFSAFHDGGQPLDVGSGQTSPLCVDAADSPEPKPLPGSSEAPDSVFPLSTLLSGSPAFTVASLVCWGRERSGVSAYDNAPAEAGARRVKTAAIRSVLSSPPRSQPDETQHQ